MTKLSSEQIVLIRNSPQTMIQLAKFFGVTYNAIRYHKDPSFKSFLRNKKREWYSKMSPKEKKAYFSSKKDYQRAYHLKRYQNDPVWRKKQIEQSKRYQKRIYYQDKKEGITK